MRDAENSDEWYRCMLYKRILRSMEIHSTGGERAVSDALQKAFDVLLNSRTDSKKAVFFFSAGQSNVGAPPLRAAHNIVSLVWNTTWMTEELGPQVEIYALGFHDADMDELKLIASDIPDHLAYVTSLSSFQEFARLHHISGLLYIIYYYCVYKIAHLNKFACLSERREKPHNTR